MTMQEKDKKSCVGIVLVSISIFLLLVYGSDAILDRTDGGFLPLDDRVRGFVLGIPSVILPLIAFAINWSSPSGYLGTFLFIDGIIIVIGAIAFVTLQETSETIDNTVIMENLRSFAPVIGMGALVIFLGLWKFVKS